MSIRRIFFTSLLFSYLSFTCCTDSKTENTKNFFNEIADKIHFENVIYSIRNTVNMQLSTISSSLGPSVFTRIQNAAEDAFNVGLMKSDFKNYLTQKSDSLDINNFIKWLNSPLYNKISECEIRVLNDQDYSEINSYAKLIKSDSSLYKRYLFISSSMRHEEIELTADAYAATFRTLVEASRRFVDRSRLMKDSDIDYMVQSERDGFIKNLQNDAIFEKLFRYKNLSDDELISIVEFKHSPTGKNASVFVHKAILYAVEQANHDFLNRVSKINS